MFGKFFASNIIIVMSDDHATQAISCYGSELIETPNIDRLAEQGVYFANAFVTNSICAPSRAVILTGKHSHLNGVKDNHTRFDSTQVTFPKILQNHGYETSIVGKWHLTNTNESKQKKQFPLDRGFDFFHGTWWGAKDYFSPKFMMKNDQHLKNGNYPKDYYFPLIMTISTY